MPADGYTPRWPALEVKFIESGEIVKASPRDGDIFHVEEKLGISISRIEVVSWRFMMTAAYYVLRREGDARVPEDFEAWLTVADVRFWQGDDDEVSEQGKASALAPPTGSSSASPSSQG
jgi:hypothetical protein